MWAICLQVPSLKDTYFQLEPRRPDFHHGNRPHFWCEEKSKPLGTNPLKHIALDPRRDTGAGVLHNITYSTTYTLPIHPLCAPLDVLKQRVHPLLLRQNYESDTHLVVQVKESTIVYLLRIFVQQRFHESSGSLADQYAVRGDVNGRQK